MSDKKHEEPNDENENQGNESDQNESGANEPGQTESRGSLFRMGGGYTGSKRTMTWIVLGILLVFILLRTGFFEQWGNQPPVRHLISDPEISMQNGNTEVTYWLHVPVGTEVGTTETLISDFLIREVRRQMVDEFRVSEADTVRFFVFDSPKPGTDELKTVKVDEPDHTYRYDMAANTITKVE